jgi:5-methylcytosine-specific restriction endonuclease McrA
VPYADLDKQREFQRKWARNNRKKRKERVIALLGGECVRCGNADSRVLEIDHVVPLRRKDRTNNCSDSGSELWRRVLAGQVAKDDVQLLCANCHAIKTLEDDPRN